VGLLGLSLTDNQVLRLDPGSPSLVKAHDHVIGYNPFLPTLIKSSGAKNCRVSIPVCEPYTKPLGTKCRPPTQLGSLAMLVIPRGKVGTTSTRSENGSRRSSVSYGRLDSISATTEPRFPCFASFSSFHPCHPRLNLVLPYFRSHCLYILCPSISANYCWCHSDVAYTSPCFVLVLYNLVYAAEAPQPSYSNSTHLSVTSLYTLPAILTNLKLRFILVLIPTE